MGAPPADLEQSSSRVVVVVGGPGAGHAAFSAALLLAPGVWSGDATLTDLLLADPPDADAITAAMTSPTELARRAEFAGGETRMVLADPRLSARVDEISRLLPGAVFVHLHREPTTALADTLLAEDGSEASTTTPPRVVRDWAERVTELLDDLDALPAQRRVDVSVEGLLAEPVQELQRVFAATGLGWHARAGAEWRRTAAPLAAIAAAPIDPVLLPLLGDLEPVVVRARGAVPALQPSLLPTSGAVGLTVTDRGLAKLLKRVGASLLVSTYQSNRLMSLRPDRGRLGVHLRAFDRPMGIAVTPGGFALGVRSEVLDYRDFPQVAERLEPARSVDACYLPRNSHVTGDISVHDLGLGRNGLWVVATKFSCLATLDTQHSFVPQWRPPFISALAAEDRCHLNGVALVDGLPRYTTALGVSDEPGGWRAGLVGGGVLMEVPSGKVLLDGLSMPHSPRWYDDRLWLLESGRGRLLSFDPAEGTVEVVTELRGFTRGLALHEGHAFVGTSQVRETATFGGLPIAQQGDLECGVSAVDLATGSVVASARFEDRVQELFDVAVLPGVLRPEIAELDSELTRTSWILPG